MGRLGVEFRRLREAKGASLEQVAAATKVGVHHLDALERGDFKALPGDVFVRGFVRAYAGFLGAEPERLLTLYRRDREGLEPDAPAVAERTVQEMSRLLAGSRGGLALRITLDRSLGQLALRIGAFAAILSGVAALAIVVLGPRDEEADRSQIAGPLRASRSATEMPPTSSASIAVDSSPTPGESAPQSTPSASPSAPSVPPPAPSTARPSLPSPAPAPAVARERESVATEPREEGLEVFEHGVGSRIEAGRLAGRAATFDEGGTVWFWTRVDGGRPGQVVRHVWIHEDREIHTVDLEVGSAQWRTWSRKTLRPGSAGRWTVEVRDTYGRALASDEFDCSPIR